MDTGASSGADKVGQSIAGTSLDQARRSGEVGLHTVRGTDGEVRFAVFTPLSGDGRSADVHVALSIPRDEVFAQANWILRRNLLWLGIVCIGVLAVARFGGELFIVRQVNNVLKAAQRIAASDLKARTGVPYEPGAGRTGAKL